MSGKRYTSGEIATAAGVTVRTIQHYDNIGLLPSTGRSDGGRRYYTQDDLVRLEQIVFYKSLDFPLDQIKERLLLEPGKTELLTMLEEQRLLLLQRMEHLHTSFATIGIMSEMIESDREPPFALMLRFLSALPGDDVFSRAPQLLTEEQREALSPRFQDIEPVQTFYHRWKEVLIEAAVLVHENAPPDSAAAQELAKRWWNAILSLTSGDMDLIEQLSQLRLEDQMGTRDDELMDSASRYMEAAFGLFSANGGPPPDPDGNSAGEDDDDRAVQPDETVR